MNLRLPRLLGLVAALSMFSFASADPLPIGASAPAVSAQTDAGTTLDLASAYASNAYTLVYFYPKADTPGCTAQGCSLRDAYTELSAKGVAIFGVSTDSVEAQRAFKEKYKLPFTLLADTDKKVMRAFGQSGIMFASRQAYLIHKGKIVYADHKGSTKKQAEDILNFLATKAG
jgi:thioredoxin-dependent peroxiredoxin